jgi:CheY-like chemotaxis protein
MTVRVIAVVEDDVEILHMLDVLLRGASYQVISYTRGEDAHQFIRRTLPDLVILDLWLEDRNAGGMVLGLLELDPLTRNIPVIVCSAHVQVLREHAQYFTGKGHRVLPKPFEPAALLSEIETALASRRTT